MAEARGKSRIIKILLRAIGPLILIGLLSRVDLSMLWDTLKNADPLVLVLVVVASLPMFMLRTLRWLFLLSAQGKKLPYWLAFRVYLAANFFGAFTPGHVGEFIKVLYLKRYTGQSKSSGMASVITDRILDLWVIFGLGFFGMYVLHLLDRVSGFALAAAFVVLFSPLLALHRGLLKTGVKLLFRFTFLKRFTSEAERMEQEFTEGLVQLVNWRLLPAMLCTLLAYVIYFALCEELAETLRIGLDAWDLSMILPIATFVTMLPISPAGLGTRDMTLIFLFGLSGVAQEQALAFSLLLFVIFLVILGLFGYLFWITLPKPEDDPELL